MQTKSANFKYRNIPRLYMWTIKIKVREKWNPYSERTAKHGVKLFFYSHNSYEDKKKIYFIASGIIHGEENQKKKFFLDLKKDKKVEALEFADDFFICTYSETNNSGRSKAAKIAYNPRLIFIKPVIIDEEGWEEWEVASTKRKDLEEFITNSQALENVESDLIYFKEQKVKNIMIYSLLPSLTKKQKQALILAAENNYYGYPRKIKLEKLAKMMRVSLSTYQFHLARAEAKLLPFVIKRISE